MRSSIPSFRDLRAAVRGVILSAALLTPLLGELARAEGQEAPLTPSPSRGAGETLVATPRSEALQGMVSPAAGAASAPRRKERAEAEVHLYEAKVAFETATRAYEERRYAEALAGFQSAYRRAPLPAFLFNIGQCQRLLNRPTEALAAYRRYLESSPEPPSNSELTRELISDMEGRLAWQRRTELELRGRIEGELRPLVEQELKERYEQRLQVSLASSLESQAAALRASSQAPTVRNEPLHRRWYFWAGVGAFLVASGTSMVVFQEATRAEAARR